MFYKKIKGITLPSAVDAEDVLPLEQMYQMIRYLGSGMSNNLHTFKMTYRDFSKSLVKKFRVLLEQIASQNQFNPRIEELVLQTHNRDDDMQLHTIKLMSTLIKRLPHVTKLSYIQDVPATAHYMKTIGYLISAIQNHSNLNEISIESEKPSKIILPALYEHPTVNKIRLGGQISRSEMLACFALLQTNTNISTFIIPDFTMDVNFWKVS